MKHFTAPPPKPHLPWPGLKQCEECDLWVPKEDICYLAGIQKELCAECASDHGSEDWK